MNTVLSASVGKGGRNVARDVETVQQALNSQIAKLVPLAWLVEDGKCGPATAGAITEFQRRVLRHKNPDGLVTPKGPTWKALGGQLARQQAKNATGGWTGDAKLWSQEKKLLSMEPILRRKVETVLQQLEAQGFEPQIFYAWRSQAEQQKIIARGNSTVKISMHNITRNGLPYSYAADIVDKRYLWNTPACKPFFAALGKEAKAIGLVWGGDWTRPDWAHVQSIPVSQQAAIRRKSN